MYDLMIIGAGPAGLCAGIYAARKQLNTVLISGDIGGQMNNTTGIEKWLGYFFSSARYFSGFWSKAFLQPTAQK